MKRGISACIIGKDEEKNLDRCLKSIVEIVNEIIYFDFGSTDKSIEIAKKYNCKIYKGKFENDFSKARNICKSYANYQWILAIDCDEALSETSKNYLKDIIKLEDYEALLVNIINIVDDEPWDRFEFPRIFKNKKEYCYKGKIHEQIAPSIVKIHGISALKESNIEILHYGYNCDNNTENNKHKRNLEILNSVEEEFRNDFYYYNLGNEYARVSDYDRAIDNYEKAIKIIKGREAYTVLLYERLAHFYYLTYKYEKCIKTALLGISQYINHMYFYYIAGLSYIEQMRFTKAYQALNIAKNLLEETLKIKDYIPVGFGITKKSELEEVIQELKDCIILDKEKLITTIINCEDDKLISLDTINSVNEISEKIIVVIEAKNKDDKSDIVNYKAVKLSEVTEKAVIEEAIKVVETEYILFLKNGEGLTFDDEKALVEIINREKKNYYYLYNIKENENIVRVMKKDEINMLNKVNKNIKAVVNISYI